jgi:hypothetical protein
MVGRLRKYSGYILVAPGLVPFFPAFLVLPDTVIGYYHFLRHDILSLRQCTVSEYGRLVPQDDPNGRYYRETVRIRCVYNGITGFHSADSIQHQYALLFTEAALFIFAGSIVLFLFSKKWPDLAAKGLLP